jgi:hypothetical protein
MLTITSSRNESLCNSNHRRDFMKIGALGLGGLTLPGLLKARAAESQAGRVSKNTSVIWLWLSGGPTHVETFDPKPDAPAEYRSTTGQVATKIPGVQLGGNFEKIAGLSDRFAFFRSFAHRNSGHGGGTHWVMTGYDFVAADNGGGQNKPGMGAILARHRGATATSGLPTYIKTNGILGDGAAWLGRAYAPFEVAGRAKENLSLKGSLERLDDRKSLLKDFDTLSRSVDQTGLMKGLDSFGEQALDIVVSKAKEAFDIKLENQKTRDRYGKGLGEQLLLARRLCEAGAGFVTINFGGWDMHGQIANSMKRLGPIVDNAVSAFVEDRAERGLENDILLVVTGEFGRTPRINNSGGRDHWAPLSTLALSGGGLKMGQVIGESTAKAEVPKTKPVSPQDLMATVFHVLGVPQEVQFTDPSGRPMNMINGGKPVSELV